MTPADINWGQVLLVAISGSGILTVALMAIINRANERAKAKQDAASDAAKLKLANEQRESDMQNTREAAEQAAAAAILQFGLKNMQQLQAQNDIGIQREQVWLAQIQMMQTNVNQVEKNFNTQVELLRTEVQGLRMDNEQKDKVIAKQAAEIVQLRQEKETAEAARDRLIGILKQHGLEAEIINALSTAELKAVAAADPPSSSKIPGVPLN